jgi:hypothetical protein
MGTEPNSTTITLDQVAMWLRGIAQGVIVLDRDNEAMAAAALGYLGETKPTSTAKEGACRRPS